MSTRQETEDTSPKADAEKLVEAYLRRRLELLGMKLTESDTVYAFEITFNVMPLDDGKFDVAFVTTICACDRVSRRGGGMRGPPFDLDQFHEYADLEDAARVEAEAVFSEVKSLEATRPHLKRP